MAYVTFIIGNGLDLSLGLKTNYRDFYQYVRENNLHPKNRIYKAISESPDSWADFELALGKYTSYIDNVPESDKKQESVKLHEELEDLRDDLAIYLEAEEASNRNTAHNLILTNRGYMSELHPGVRQRAETALARTQTFFQFVSLNYTKTLEQVIENSTYSLQANSIGIIEPHHIHGDLTENLTLGVSDDTQLSESMSGAEKDDLIKPDLIYSMNDGRIEAMVALFDRSSIIVLYGTSIGETDGYIWKSVTKWLGVASDRYVIIHKHDSSYTETVKRSSRRQKQFISSVQEQLLSFSGQDGDTIERLRSRIFVVHNTKNMFKSD